MFKCILICLLVSNGAGLFAQSGDEWFNKQDYLRAVRSYKLEVARDPSKNLNLAKAHFALQEFEEAKAAMKAYRDNAPGADKVLADNWLKLLNRDDQSVRIENIGEGINSSKDDFLPRISSDGKTLYFLSNGRVGGKGGEDIWFTNRNADGSWGTPQNLSALNTSSHEGILTISPDGNVAVVFGNYPGSFGGGDLFYSVKTENGWTYPCNMGGTINTKGWESLGALGPDAKTLIFSSDRTDGQGNSDLYITQLGENGWSTPKNIGKTVNTKGDEKFPYIAADGKTLYFSSSGHAGFGGLDLFMVKRLDDTWTNWTEPINLGRYINTLGDDKDFSISGSGITGYLSRSGAPDTYGANDIYSFYMPSAYKPEQVFNVYGRISDNLDSSVLANIRYLDIETGKEINKTTSDIENGFYSVALAKNKKYEVVINMKGYLYFSEILDLTDPRLYEEKEGFNLKLKEQRESINRLSAELTRLNRQLEQAINSNSINIQALFDEVDRTVKDYKKNLADLERLMAESKYRWLEEQGKQLNLMRDYRLQKATVGVTFELKNIFFDFGKATLKNESLVELQKLFEIMSRSEMVIELGGHTDSIGSKEANQKLSQERVNSVKAWLVNKGIDQQRMSAVGYGADQPIADNRTDAGRALNRRVEVKILRLTLEREGGEMVSDDDRKKKKEKKPEESLELAPKGNMLDLLQVAAKNGGLPSGSKCNDQPIYTQPRAYNYNNRNYNIPNTKWKDNKWGYNEKLTRDDYSLKAFNIGISNYGLKTLNSGSLGAEVNFVSKKLNENRLIYYFINPDSIKSGLGYSGLFNLQLGNSPIMLMWGVNLRYFYGNPNGLSATGDYWFGHTNIPIGLRYQLKPFNKIYLTPDAGFQFQLAESNEFSAFNGNATGLYFGTLARYGIISGGLQFNLNSAANALQFRAGLSF